MTQLLSQFTPTQRSAVVQLGSPSEIPVTCPLSFNGLSPCYAAISFSDVVALKNTPPNSVNYTIFVDPGLNFVDVVRHTSDVETRIFPLQWSIDQVRRSHSFAFLPFQDRHFLGYYRVGNWSSPRNPFGMAIYERNER